MGGSTYVCYSFSHRLLCTMNPPSCTAFTEIFFFSVNPSHCHTSIVYLAPPPHFCLSYLSLFISLSLFPLSLLYISFLSSLYLFPVSFYLYIVSNLFSLPFLSFLSLNLCRCMCVGVCGSVSVCVCVCVCV